MRDLSISVYFARSVLKNAVTQGLDPISLLRKNRVSPRLMLEDNARISIERFADLQVATMQAMNDETLGYGTRPMPLGCWSMMCHAVIGCETLGEALSRSCRYYQLFELGVHPVLDEDGESAVIRLEPQNIDAAAEAISARAAFVQPASICQLAGAGAPAYSDCTVKLSATGAGARLPSHVSS